MNIYFNDIKTAAILFPIAAAIITLPFAIYQYRRYGAIRWLRILATYSFVLYCMCAYFLVIMPLPASRAAAAAYSVTPQLDPTNIFRVIKSGLAASGFSPLSPSTWVATLKNPSIYEIVFNVLLTMPLGAYLCYYFRRPWWQALPIGFMTSLFFETTQLTGLWGIYAHPYRLFDVSDLMTNMLGCMLGFWMACPLRSVLPNLDAINQSSLEKGMRASAVRRALSFGIDLAAIVASSLGIIAATRAAGVAATAQLVDKESLRAIVTSVKGSAAGTSGAKGIGSAVENAVDTTADNILEMVQSLTQGSIEAFLMICLVAVVWLCMVPCITRGRTIGQLVLGLVIARPDGTKARWYQYFARYLLLIGFVVVPPAMMLYALPIAQVGAATGDINALATYLVGNVGSIVKIWLVFMAVWVVSLLVRAAWGAATGNTLIMLNGLLSNTRIMTAQGAKRVRASSLESRRYRMSAQR